MLLIIARQHLSSECGTEVHVVKSGLIWFGNGITCLCCSRQLGDERLCAMLELGSRLKVVHCGLNEFRGAALGCCCGALEFP